MYVVEEVEREPLPIAANAQPATMREHAADKRSGLAD
jgi:hypothetical protein